MNKFLNAIRSHAEAVLNNTTGELFEHKGHKGEIKEDLIKKFLRPLLPNRYGLGTGEVFSQEGDTSSQLDIVIYDSVFSNVFFNESRMQMFPCESVFGLIEVKSHLYSKDLLDDVKKISSMKRLVRESTTTLNLLPTLELVLGPGLKSGSEKRNDYLGYILAYDGMGCRKVIDLLNSCLKESDNCLLLPDFVFNLQKGI